MLLTSNNNTNGTMVYSLLLEYHLKNAWKKYYIYSMMADLDHKAIIQILSKVI